MLLLVKTWGRRKHLLGPAHSLSLPASPLISSIRNSLAPVYHLQEILLVRRHALASQVGAFIGSRAHQFQVSTCTLLPRLLMPVSGPPVPPWGLAVSHPPNCDENSGTYTAAGYCQRWDANYTKCVVFRPFFKKKKANVAHKQKFLIRSIVDKKISYLNINR